MGEHHADASHFRTDASKSEVYAQLLLEAETLFEGQRHFVCNLANAASLLWHALHSLPAPLNRVNWAGFYFLPSSIPSTNEARPLLLGPFHGRPACQSISIAPPVAGGKQLGVCGAAFVQRKTIRAANVLEYPGHIACDAESKSEIVVPVLADPVSLGGEHGGERGKHRETVVAIIDIDCAEFGGFDDQDQDMLERFAELLGRACHWPAFEQQE